MVEREVGHRPAAPPAPAPRVERRRGAKLHALGPERVVVVVAVDAQRVEAAVVRRGSGALPRQLGHRTQNVPQRDDLQAKVLDGVLGLGDRLLGRVRGHYRRRRHAVCIGGIDLRLQRVDRPATHGPQLRVGQAAEGQRIRRVLDAEVDSQLVHPLVEQPRQRHRRPVEGIRRRMHPPRRTGRPVVAALLVGHRIPGIEHRDVVRGVAGPLEPQRHVVTADLPDGIEEGRPQHRRQLKEVSVGVDDRMAQRRPDLGRPRRHGPPSASFRSASPVMRYVVHSSIGPAPSLR